MKTEAEWDAQVKGIIRGELKRRNMTYEQLAGRLAELGVNETHASITNKISRGRFTAVFMVQCLEAIGCRTLRIDAD